MTILDRIVATKRNEVDLARRLRPQANLALTAVAMPAARDFFAAVTEAARGGPNLIAEIKKASPSAGVIVRDFDPVALANVYAQSGVSAISVLTDKHFFQGDLGFIDSIKNAIGLPVLRKDFIVDAYQLYESRAAQADAVLLIAEVLSISGLADLLPIALDLGLTPLVEVHSAEVLVKTLKRFGPPHRDSYILGINNRDLYTQRVDVSTMVRLGSMLPPGAPFVAESGLVSRDDVLRAKAAGACAVLIGESILRSRDIGAKIAQLTGNE